MSEARLSSWKEIAAYLKCDESTARRWRRDNRLPVYSIGNKGSSVHAFTDELDGWVRDRKSQFDQADIAEQTADSTKSAEAREYSEPPIGAEAGEPGPSLLTPPPVTSPINKSSAGWLFRNRNRLIAVCALASIVVISGIIRLTRRSIWVQARQPSEFRQLGAGQSLVDVNNIDNSAADARNEEELAVHLKVFVKETQIWEMLSLYSSPWNCDARDIQRYWLVGSKAFNDIGASVSRLNERGLHYGYDSRLLDFQFRYIRISPDGASATLGTREHWWLPVYTRDEKLAPNRNADQGPYEIEYLLTKVDGFWYIQSTSTPYTQWKPKAITCRNWPQMVHVNQ
jgi:hypothetical protein